MRRMFGVGGVSKNEKLLYRDLARNMEFLKQLPKPAKEKLSIQQTKNFQ